MTTTITLRDLRAKYADDELRVPEWTLGDRMGKALRLAGLNATVMAEAFGVSQATVGRWISGKSKPSAANVAMWAIATGVDEEWLETGVPSAEAAQLALVRSNTAPAEGEGREVAVRHQGLEPRTR